MVDVGCGSGQSTAGFATYFSKVIGCDPSPNQIEVARSNNNCENIVYQVGPAENLDVPPGSVDLVTSGQAVHWFDFKAFFNECHRVLKPNGCLLLHGYDRPHLSRSQELADQTVDSLFTSFYKQCRFHARRKHIDDHYTEIHSMISSDHSVKDDTAVNTVPCKLSDFVQYLQTWSGYKSYQESLNDSSAEDILLEFISSVRKHWEIDLSTPNSDVDIVLKFPIFMILSQRPHLV